MHYDPLQSAVPRIAEVDTHGRGLGIVDFLKFEFPAGYKGPVSTPVCTNHPSASGHIHDLAAYITTEVRELREGAMLGPFDQPPFIRLCR